MCTSSLVRRISQAVDDIIEALTGAGAELGFGLAFLEVPSAFPIRRAGNAGNLTELAASNAASIGAGHSFIIFLRGGYPIGTLDLLKRVPEVFGLYYATSDQVEVLVARTSLGRTIVGVVEGNSPPLDNPSEDVHGRKHHLRELGYDV
jgi:hypothetical protein